MIHIEGMGLLGSMLARRLAREDIEFTWNDIDSPHVAWHACTGLAYPDGDPYALAGLARWEEETLMGRTPEAASAPFVFAHKKNPHEGTDGIMEDYGPLRRGNRDAVALNAPQYVRNTRDRYQDWRTDGARPGDTVVVAHLTPERGNGYLWGWSAQVELELPDYLDALPDRPALYAKTHRFNLTYAYPTPLTSNWWAGSTNVIQMDPKPVTQERLDRYVQEWVENARELLEVEIIDVREVFQGWRPRHAVGDSRAPEWVEDRLVLPALSGSGMRLGLIVTDRAAEMLLI